MRSACVDVGIQTGLHMGFDGTQADVYSGHFLFKHDSPNKPMCPWYVDMRQVTMPGTQMIGMSTSYSQN